ncbi:MAG: archaellin/type IV pilin N-terminal domain-containing protein [Nanoarchaeota archaeon]
MWGKKRWRTVSSKRGISPLIATVLLIAFAVALGAMIMNWSSNLLSESSLAGVCEKVKISLVGKFCWKDNQINIEILNSGTSEVQELVLRASSKDAENEIHMKESKLGVNLRFARQVTFSKGEEGTKYEIIPSVGSSDSKILCDKQSIKLDRLENC